MQEVLDALVEEGKAQVSKKGGKYVAPGVYFYVIEAEGSDGKKYKKKGDINILRPKNEDNSSSDLENSSL